MMSSPSPRPTAYALLGIHPSAPWELADAAYWWAAIALQEQRAVDRDADAALHRLTRAFETLADAQRREAYDVAIGYRDEPLVSRQLLKSRQSVFSRIFRRKSATLPAIDYYEVIGLDESAPANWIPEARRIMRDHYLNVPDDRRQPLLLSLLDEAYGVLSDVGTRAQYDEECRRKAPHLRQRSSADSDPSGATPDEKTRDSLDELTPRGEATSPEGAAEQPGERPKSPTRIARQLQPRRTKRSLRIAEQPDEPPKSPTPIAPQVQPRRTKRSARIAAGDDLSHEQPSAESDVNLEPGPAIEPGLPPRIRPLLSLVVQRAGATATLLGRAVAVIGRAAAALIRGTATSVAALLRSKLRKRASVLPAFPAWEPRAGTFAEIQPAVDEESDAWLELPTGQKYAMGKAPVTIGDTPDCVVGSPDGSGGGYERARIWRRDGRFMLHSLSSPGDVVVAGKPVAWVILEDGDDIVLGQQKIVFRNPRPDGE